MQTVFPGFCENGDILNDSQKIRLLFQKVQHPILPQIKVSLQVSYDLYQSNAMTYNFISNSLAAEAASQGDHTPREVGDVNTRGKKTPESGVNESDGTIFTGFYPNWSEILNGEKKSILDKRERLNIKGGGKCKYFDKKKHSISSYIKYKKKTAEKNQHEISPLKSKCKEPEEKRITSKEADEPQDNVGNQFGGRKGKNQQKSSE